MALISVVLPIRSIPLRLGIVIDSLVAQSLIEWELIALLDRDTDGKNSECLKSRLGSSRIHIINVDLTRVSFAEALNIGVSHCNTEFVARCDDDDQQSENRFFEQYELLRRNPRIVVATGNAMLVNELNQNLGTLAQSKSHKTFLRELAVRNVIPHSGTMFRRSAFLKCGGYRAKMDGCEDYDLWLRISRLGEIRSTNTVALFYFVNESGMHRKPLSSWKLKKLRESQRDYLDRNGCNATTREVLVWTFWLKQSISQLVRFFKLT